MVLYIEDIPDWETSGFENSAEPRIADLHRRQWIDLRDAFGTSAPAPPPRLVDIIAARKS